jgi:ankyrin repeat protein
MFSVFDILPLEIILLVVDDLDPEDLRSLLRGIRWFAKILTSQQVSMITDKSGNTVLHLLAQAGEADLIKPLLSKDNLNPDLRNMNGQTPLFYAVSTVEHHCIGLQ